MRIHLVLLLLSLSTGLALTVAARKGDYRFLRFVMPVILTSLFLWHLGTIREHSLDVPVWDEWSNFSDPGLSREFSIPWIFSHHNEHMIVPSRLQTWLLYRINGWDLASHVTVNFFIWGTAIAVLFLVMRNLSRGMESWVIISFLIFLLSDIAWENHAWGFQSAFHFTILFFLLALLCLFSERQRGLSLAMGIVSLAISAFSLSTGLPAALGVVMGFTAFKLFAFWTQPTKRSGRDLAWAITVPVLFVGTVVLWRCLNHGLGTAPGNLAFPNTAEFWLYLWGLISFGFGFEYHKGDVAPFLIAATDAVCTTIVVLPCVLIPLTQRLDRRSFGIITGIVSTVLMLSLIAMGRGMVCVLQASQSSRYGEIAMLLVPFSALAWHHLLSDSRRASSCALLVIFTLCAVSFANNWQYRTRYGQRHAQYAPAIDQLKAYYEGTGAARCASFPWDIPEQFDRARELNVSFYQRIANERSPKTIQ